MIINWAKKGAGLLTISKIENEAIVKTIFILPGFNDIEDKDWEGIKNQLLDKIKSGDIRVVEEEVEKKVEVNGKIKTKKYTAKQFANLSANKALEVVAEAWDLKTLEKWRGEESRDEIRAALAEQIEKVKNPKKTEDTVK
jgi:hypothetical protein